MGLKTFFFISEELLESPHSKGPEEEKYLKIVAQLLMEGNLSNIFLKGLYNPRVGIVITLPDL